MPDTSVARTETAPGWSTILTGVWPTKHLVTANTPMPTALDRYPDVLSRAEAATPRRRTMAAVGAAMIAGDFGPGPLLGSQIDDLIFHDRRLLEEAIFEADRRVLTDAVTGLTERDAQLSFVYFGIADKTAHRNGSRSEAYLDALRTLDERLGLLLAAVDARPSRAEEDWLVIVTTDHGHRDEGGHGGDTPAERQSFVAARGIGSGPLADGRWVANVDIAPTLLTHLGIDLDPEWDLDGRPLQNG